MATFGFRKDEDEMEGAILIAEDWYGSEIQEEPVLKANNVLKELMGEDPSPDNPEVDPILESNAKAGFNMVIDLRLISELPEANNRFFRLHLPYPNEYDEERYDAIGQKVYDAKMSRIIEFTKKFGGSVDGDNVTLMPGLKGQVYIEVGQMKGRDEKSNSINPFAGFKMMEG